MVSSTKKSGFGGEVGMWLIPLIGVCCILIAWFIAYSLGQGVGDREREAFANARDAQVASCERVNVLREEVNTHVDILGSFLTEAATARESAGSDIDVNAAARYRELAEELEPLDIPDCEAAFPDYLESLNR